jgi:hypothetical protein
MTARAVVPKKFGNLGFAQSCGAFLRERGCENCQPQLREIQLRKIADLITLLKGRIPSFLRL